MKKNILLKLGLSSLVVLPIVAVASCSTTQKQSTQNLTKLNQEVQKFNKDFDVKASAPTNSLAEAIFNINTAQTDEEKWNHLENLIDLPPTNNEFNYTVQSVRMAEASNSSLTTSLVITQLESGSSELINFRIANLAPLKTESELSKLAKSLLVNKPAASETLKKETAVMASQNIKKNNSLYKYYRTVNLGENISYAYESSIFSGNNVEVTVLVSTTVPNVEPIYHTFSITGFRAPNSLEEAASKFAVTLPSKDPKTFITSVIRRIYETRGIEAKVTELQDIVDLPDYGTLWLKINTPYRDPKHRSWLHLPIDVHKSEGSKLKTPVVMTLTNLVPETAQQEAIRLTKEVMIDQEANVGIGNSWFVKTTAAEAYEDMSGIDSLHRYYLPKTIAWRIEYYYVGKAIDPVEPNILRITIKVDAEGINPFNHTFGIIFKS